VLCHVTRALARRGIEASQGTSLHSEHGRQKYSNEIVFLAFGVNYSPGASQNGGSNDGRKLGGQLIQRRGGGGSDNKLPWALVARVLALRLYV
jgi:hypothetical protein